ncbi:MAG: hypothetical protein M3P98_02265 [bacterium]|nr:hypothetical protein [bacterium]
MAKKDKLASIGDVERIVDNAIETKVRRIVSEALNEAVKDLTTVITDLATQIDIRFRVHDDRFDKIDERFDGVYSILDGMSKKIDDNHIEQMALTSQVDRHDRWINKMAKKYDVKLLA